MEEKVLLRQLRLPRTSHVLRTFPFNRLAGQLTSEKRKYLSEAIEARGIRLLATINSQTTNIPMYEDEHVSYQEIHLFNIKLNDLKKSERVYKILAEMMPYPLLIRFEKDDQAKWIAASHEKVQKTNLLKVKKVFTTNTKIDERLYLNNWTFDKSDTYNLKAYYEDVIKQIAQVELEHQYKVTNRSDEDLHRLAEIKALEKQISTYVAKAKKETQMNKRIEFQMEANKLKTEKEKLIKGD